MKSKLQSYLAIKDTPAIRKRRLQARLQEISDRGEQELTALLKSLERIKSTFTDKPVR